MPIALPSPAQSKAKRNAKGSRHANLIVNKPFHIQSHATIAPNPAAMHLAPSEQPHSLRYPLTRAASASASLRESPGRSIIIGVLARKSFGLLKLRSNSRSVMTTGGGE
jgi:hypothetical protein